MWVFILIDVLIPTTGMNEGCAFGLDFDMFPFACTSNMNMLNPFEKAFQLGRWLCSLLQVPRTEHVLDLTVQVSFGYCSYTELIFTLDRWGDNSHSQTEEHIQNYSVKPWLGDSNPNLLCHIPAYYQPLGSKITQNVMSLCQKWEDLSSFLLVKCYLFSPLSS